MNFYATCSNRLMWAICQQLIMTKMVTKSKLFEVGGFTCLPIIAYCLLCTGCLSQRKLSCSPEFPSFLSYWLPRKANGSVANLKEHWLTGRRNNRGEVGIQTYFNLDSGFMSHAESRVMGVCVCVSSGGLDVGLPSMGKRWGRDPRLHADVCVEQWAVGVDILFPSQESQRRVRKKK